MPNIEEYNSQVNPETTLSTKEASGVSTGPGLEAVGSGIEKLGAGMEQYQTRKEGAIAYNELSHLQTDFVAKYKNIKQSMKPEDLEKFMQDNYETPADAIRGKMQTSGGSELFEKNNRYARDMLYQGLVVKNAVLEGQESTGRFEDTAASLDKLAYSQKSAPQLEELSRQMKDAGETLKTGNALGNAAVDDKVKMHLKNLAIAQAKGIIASGPGGPDEALQALKDGRWDDVINYRETGPTSGQDQIRAWADGAKRNAETQKTVTQNRILNTTRQVQEGNFQGLMSDVYKGNVNISTIENMTDFGDIKSEQRQHAITVLQHISAGTLKGDPLTIRLAQSQIRNGQISDFTQLVKQHGLETKSIDDRSMMRLGQQFLAKDDNPNASFLHTLSDEAEKQLVQKTNVSLGDREGMKRWAQCLNAVHDKSLELQKQGMPQDKMFAPDGPLYKIIGQYQRTPQEIQQQQRDAFHSKWTSYPYVDSKPVGTDPNQAKIAPSNPPDTSDKDEAKRKFREDINNSVKGIR